MPVSNPSSVHGAEFEVMNPVCVCVCVTKSAFIKKSIISTITSGLDIANDFKDKFVDQGYTTITEANTVDAFKQVSNNKLISFLWDNYEIQDTAVRTSTLAPAFTRLLALRIFFFFSPARSFFLFFSSAP